MLFEKVLSLVRLVDEFDVTTTLNAGFVGDVGRALIFGMVTAVSYTHLTLPTKRIV